MWECAGGTACRIGLVCDTRGPGCRARDPCWWGPPRMEPGSAAAPHAPGVRSHHAMCLLFVSLDL
eukprot:187129-Alexandrium_andersonii.AAC.1